MHGPDMFLCVAVLLVRAPRQSSGSAPPPQPRVTDHSSAAVTPTSDVLLTAMNVIPSLCHSRAV